MHGGKRLGAGRPKGEETKTIRVPLGCLNSVAKIISEYKSSPLDSLKIVTENKPNSDNLELFVDSQVKNKLISKKNIKWFNRQNDPDRDSARNRIKADFGTLQNFINRGGRISKNTAFFPAVA